MSGDWLLTLSVVMAPFLLGATIVVVAMIRNLIQNERIRRTAETSAHDGADQIEEARRILS
ncbi:MAG: hypothetical protein ACJ789_02110 [Thermomicrobiales bacterium]